MEIILGHIGTWNPWRNAKEILGNHGGSMISRNFPMTTSEIFPRTALEVFRGIIPEKPLKKKKNGESSEQVQQSVHTIFVCFMEEKEKKY